MPNPKEESKGSSAWLIIVGGAGLISFAAHLAGHDIPPLELGVITVIFGLLEGIRLLEKILKQLETINRQFTERS